MDARGSYGDFPVEKAAQTDLKENKANPNATSDEEKSVREDLAR